MVESLERLMAKYGQYCPVAKALELVGDRWTLLIIRDLLTGTRHFNDLEHGLPGISRALLAQRLRQLQQAGVITKQFYDARRNTTEYQLTQAGQDLLAVIMSLRVWGETWAFGDPTPDELDPVLLMWWLRKRVNIDRLPADRIVVQFDFRGAKKATFWLILTTDDVSLCLTEPGYEIDVLVTADLTVFLKLWAGRISYQEALINDEVSVEAIPSLIRAFPEWFGWSAQPPLQNASHASYT
jgi:DNA-binding HxlR family transcriptional regulator